MLDFSIKYLFTNILKRNHSYWTKLNLNFEQTNLSIDYTNVKEEW